MTLRLTTDPIDTVEPTECTAPPAAGRVECPRCEKTFGLGAVVVDDIKPMPFANGMDIVRVPVGRCRFYCDHCNHIVQWCAEICEGKPTRNHIGATRFSCADKTVAAFLSEHPQAKGVL